MRRNQDLKNREEQIGKFRVYVSISVIGVVFPEPPSNVDIVEVCTRDRGFPF